MAEQEVIKQLDETRAKLAELSSQQSKLLQQKAALEKKAQKDVQVQLTANIQTINQLVKDSKVLAEKVGLVFYWSEGYEEFSFCPESEWSSSRC